MTIVTDARAASGYDIEMKKKILIPVLAAGLLIVVGLAIPGSSGGGKENTVPEPLPAIPPLDTGLPAVTETATFALG